MKAEDTKGELLSATFEYEGEEYEIKASVVSSSLAIKLMRAADQSFWECTMTEEDFVKKDKRWRTFIDIEEIGEFIIFAVKKAMYSVKLTDDQVFTLMLKYQTPMKEVALSLPIPRAKMDPDKIIMLQSQTIISLRKAVKELDIKLKAQAEEYNKLLKKTAKIVPVKIFDLNATNGHNTSYSTPSTSWYDINGAKGELNLEEPGKIKWQFYATSLYCSSSGNSRVYCRVAVKNKANGQIKYWPYEGGSGYYPDSCYANVCIINDISALEAGNYELTGQWKVDSTSYPVTWYGNYNGEIKLLGDIYYGI